MKKRKVCFALFITAAIITITYLGGCDKSFTSEPMVESKYVNPFNIVGLSHNEAFSFVLKKLQDDKNNNLIPTVENELTLKVLSYIDEYNEKMGIKCDLDIYSLVCPDSDVKKLNKSIMLTKLTPEQEKYSNKIDELICTKTEVSDLAKHLNNLEKEVSEKLCELEAAPILCKSTVALASKIYWTNNLDEWLKTFVKSDKIKKGVNKLGEMPIWMRLVLADVAGAFTASMGALITGQVWAVGAAATVGAEVGTAIMILVILSEIWSGEFSDQ
jgi:hypothetical protein